ncbi:TPA: hypothetical protein ACSCYS_004235 [Aeromonas veronii]
MPPMFVVNENTLCAAYTDSKDPCPFGGDNEGVKLDVVATAGAASNTPDYLQPKKGVFTLSKYDMLRFATPADEKIFNYPQLKNLELVKGVPVEWVDFPKPSQNELRSRIDHAVSEGGGVMFSDDFTRLTIKHMRQEIAQQLSSAAEYEALAEQCAAELKEAMSDLSQISRRLTSIGSGSLSWMDYPDILSNQQTLSRRLLMLSEKAQEHHDKASSMLFKVNELSAQRMESLKAVAKAGYDTRLCMLIED